MHIKTLRISNCKSYKTLETVYFDEQFTIFVGPNGGGKSNTLDILTIALRRFFMPLYIVNEGEELGRMVKDIQRLDTFSDINRFLESFSGQEGQEVRIDVTIAVGVSDVKNIELVNAHKDKWDLARAKYRNGYIGSFSFVDNWQQNPLKAGDEFTFSIVNGGLIHTDDPARNVFKSYLEFINYFLILGGDIGIAEFRPPFVYFSPYRSTALQDIRASLSGERYMGVMQNYSNSTSQSQTSLIKLATLFFAEKKRQLEYRATSNGYKTAWEHDTDVQQVTKYMSRLGYEWELSLVDGNRNIYEIVLTKNGRTFFISRASSGEKELLNFLFGIFALRTLGGLIIIDEPELHLHPRWQSQLRDLLFDLADETSNQIILTTHSPVFITPKNIANVRRIARDNDGSTKVVSIPSASDRDERGLLHILNSHNNEKIFFADRVVLVEGIHDRLVFAKLVELYCRAINLSEVIEVVEVHGKGNFERYQSFLRRLKIPSVVIADLDYLLTGNIDGIEDLFVTEWGQIDNKVFKNKKSKDRVSMAERLESSIQINDFKAAEELWNDIKGRYRALKSPLNEQELGQLNKVFDELNKQGTYVLRRGEIETYLPIQFRGLQNTIELVKSENFLQWLKTEESNPLLIEIESIVLSILEEPTDKQDQIKQRVRTILAEMVGKMPIVTADTTSLLR